MEVPNICIDKQMFRVTLFSALVFIHAHNILKIGTMAEEYGPEERSQKAVALISHAYKTVYSHSYPSCLMTCMNESQCMSEEYGPEERSQKAVALISHAYKTVYSHSYPSCLMTCMNESQCMSFNYLWSTSQCQLNNRTKYSAESKFFIRDVSCTYMGLIREPETKGAVYRSCRHVHPLNGDGEYSIDPTLSGNPFTVYCDMTTDGGGWTAIQFISFTSSNLRFEDSSFATSSYRNLSGYNNHRQKVTSKVLLQLQNDMGFKQFRFYSCKKKVGTVFHIMTNVNPLGEAVVKHFTDDNLVSTRPQACGSYIGLPDDNSTMAKDCSKLEWNGTHADGKWTRFSARGEARFFQAIRREKDGHLFASFPTQRFCDDATTDEGSLSPGDT